MNHLRAVGDAKKQPGFSRHLAARGLVQQAADANDKRTSLVFIGDLGLEVVTQMPERLGARWTVFFAASHGS